MTGRKSVWALRMLAIIACMSIADKANIWVGVLLLAVIAFTDGMLSK